MNIFSIAKSESGRQRSFSSIALFVTTLFLIAVESIFFLPSISTLAQGFFTLFLPTDVGSFALWMIIPIVYCSIVSILLQPKKLLNPIYIQVGTASFVILIAIVKITTVNILAIDLQSIGALFLLFTVSALLFVMIGMIQWLIVSWVIAMNYEDSDRVSFIVNMETKEILHKLGSSFLDTWNFNRQCDMGEIWRLDRSDGNWHHLLLEIGPHPKEDKKSILATVAYEIHNDWIIKSDIAKYQRTIIVEDIEKRLGLNFSKNQTDLDDPVSRLANSNVKDLGRSKIEVTWGFLRNISRFYQITLSLTIILLVVLSVIYFQFSTTVHMSSGTYLEAAIALIICLFVEIGFPLREELSKKKREELEF
jgi:hypothetical protein